MFLTVEQTRILDNLSLVAKGAQKRASALPDYLLNGVSCRRQIVSLLAKKIIRQEADGTFSQCDTIALRRPDQMPSHGSKNKALVARAEAALADIHRANDDRLEECAKVRQRAAIQDKVERMMSLQVDIRQWLETMGTQEG